MTWALVAIAVCVLVEGLFSGAEIGFYSVNRLRLRSRLEADYPGAAVLDRLLRTPDATIMTTLIGTNVMVYAATAIATELLGAHRRPEVLATAALTPIIFLFGEMIPKDLFRRRADSLMYVLAGPIEVLRVLVWPITAVLRGLVALITGGVSARDRGAVLSRAALREWIAEGRREGVLSDYQLALSGNVMDLLNKTVAMAMIPLAETKMVSADLSGEALRAAIREARHSRLPVYQGTRENIVGILHALDYICAAGSGPPATEPARDVPKVRRTDGIHAALVALQRRRRQMAIVVDDGDTPVGIVTMKDLVEEIVGELQDF